MWLFAQYVNMCFSFTNNIAAYKLLMDFLKEKELSMFFFFFFFLVINLFENLWCLCYLHYNLYFTVPQQSIDTTYKKKIKNVFS